MRLGTRHMLEKEIDLRVVGEAEDGLEALDLIKRLQPDVAVLDVRMPRLNGIEVLRQVKGCCPDARTLMLSAYDDDDYVLAAMEAGATGYMLKTANARQLVEAVRVVSQGETVLHPAIAAKVARLWARQGARPEHSMVDLTAREMEVLVLAAKGHRNRSIADILNISSRTVEGHFKSIFDKLGLSSRVEAVLYAVSHHMVDLDDHEDGGR